MNFKIGTRFKLNNEEITIIDINNVKGTGITVKLLSEDGSTHIVNQVSFEEIAKDAIIIYNV